MKVLTIFSWFEVWYISPLNTWKQQDLGFAYIKGGKMSNLKSKKIGENSLLVTFLFTGPIILAKGMIWNNVPLSII